MAGSDNLGRQRSAVARIIAWIIFIVWGGFWVVFNLASGISEMGNLGTMGMISRLVFSVAVLIVMWISWRWEIWGGLLLILCGILEVFFFNLGRTDLDPLSNLLLFAIMGLPALLVGMLLVLCGMQVMRGASENRLK